VKKNNNNAKTMHRQKVLFVVDACLVDGSLPPGFCAFFSTQQLQSVTTDGVTPSSYLRIRREKGSFAEGLLTHKRERSGGMCFIRSSGNNSSALEFLSVT
jgi:hypothetical protein